MQIPSTHILPGSQLTVAQGSASHAPARQSSPSAQVTRLHGSTQAPSLQTRPAGHEMRAQASGTHAPAEQTCKSGQTTPAQRSTQLPSTQSSAAPQVAVSHPGSTHRPAVGVVSRASQARSAAHSGTASSVQLQAGPQSVVAAGSRATQT